MSFIETPSTSQLEVLELKGTNYTLSTLYIKSCDIQQIQIEFDKKITAAPQFFVGAPVILDFSYLEQRPCDLKPLLTYFQNHSISIVGVTREHKQIVNQAKELQIAVLTSPKTSSPTNTTKEVSSRKTQFIRQNIRSGQQIYIPDTEIIILGSVSNGAEVISDGSIHIYGALRGKAMAGAKGDQTSCICTQALDAELVSIAGHYWLSETLVKHTSEKSCSIQLKGSSLSIEPLY